MSKPSALFVGRFQPFHIGHFLVLQGMTKVAGKITIAIGSSEKGFEDMNPFTAEERKEMIQRTLQTENMIPVFDINFIEVPDRDSDEEWAAHVLEQAGHIDKLWSGNPATIAAFADTGIEVQEIKEVPGISGEEIRAMIKEGGDWQTKVPVDVKIYLQEIDAVERIKKL